MSLENKSETQIQADDLITNDPYKTFALWMEKAKETEVNDPNAMSLATANAEGRPTNRMMLLNGLDERGFVFFTNAESRKGTNIGENPFAALCFHWKSLRWQVRVEGRVEELSGAETDAYFATRPRGSRIGAWASQQSREIADFSVLHEAVARYQAEFEGREDIPRPSYWKGFRVVPDRIEFWINGEFRLHRRYIYLPVSDGQWRIVKVNP